MKILQNQEIKRFIKFVVLNGLITILNFILYYIFNEFFHFYYIYSNVLSYIIAVLISYKFNSKIVFKVKSSLLYFIKFIILKISMGIISTLGIYFIVTILEYGKYYGNIIVTAICMLISYFLSYLVFNKKL